MSKTTNPARALLALVAAIAVAFVVAPSASAAELGSSTLEPKTSTFEGFADMGIAVAPSGKTKDTPQGLHIPISSGRVDPETGQAKFVHSGGLAFSMGSASISFDNLVVKVAGKKNVIKAEVGDGKLRFANLNAKKVEIEQKKNGEFLYSNIKVFLSKKAAKAMASEFGVDKDDLAGVKLGKLSTKFKG